MADGPMRVLRSVVLRSVVLHSVVLHSVVLLGMGVLGAVVHRGASPAAAHSGLAVASPAPGAEVGGDFDLQLFFGEPIEEVEIRVISPDGVDLDFSVTEPLEGMVVLDIPPLTVEGDYVVTYDVFYTDQAEFESLYQFSYTADAPPPVPFDLEPVQETSVLSTVAIAVLAIASILLVVLLGWRLRQVQAARIAADEGASAEAG